MRNRVGEKVSKHSRMYTDGPTYMHGMHMFGQT